MASSKWRGNWSASTGHGSIDRLAGSRGRGGGHCTAVIGFIDRNDLPADFEGGYFVVRNSWGGDGSTSHLMGPEYGGHLLMPYGCRLTPRGVQAILSDDAGKTWSFDKRVFLAWKALNTDCGYPSAVQLPDGTIVMLYYAVGTSDLPGRQCRCVRFTEKQLRRTME